MCSKFHHKETAKFNNIGTKLSAVKKNFCPKLPSVPSRINKQYKILKDVNFLIVKLVYTWRFLTFKKYRQLQI